MDSRNHSPEPSDQQLLDQIRDYAAAADAHAEQHHPAATAMITGPDTRHPRAISARPLAAVAAVVIAAAIGVGALIVANDRSTSITSGDDPSTTLPTPTSDPTPTTTTDPTPTTPSAGEATGGQVVMPDPDRWVITEAYPPNPIDPSPRLGTWAWRLDGRLHLLIDGFGGDSLGTDPATAPIQLDGDRAMMGWVDGQRRFGLQSYGATEDQLRSVATTITMDADGNPTLPGAEVVLADPGGDNTDDPTDPRQSTQVGYSPLTAGGTADPGLGATVTVIYHPGDETNLFRELFEASSMGTVSTINVAGTTGYLVTGPFGQHGLAVVDGSFSSWSAMSPDADLAAMMTSARLVPPAEWEAAIGRADDEMAQAINADAAGMINDVPDPAADPDLPRYRLGDQWEFEWVTDAGLWSREERAQRAALEASYAIGDYQLLLTQGFTAPFDDDDTGGSRRIPFEVPRLAVGIARVAEPPDQFWADNDEVLPVTIDGVKATLTMSTMMGETGTVDLARVTATDGDMVIVVTGIDVDKEQARRFVESLRWRDDDHTRGLDSTDPEIRPVAEVTGDDPSAFLYRRWTAAFRNDDGGRATISVNSMTFDEFKLMLGQRWLFYNDLVSVDGGRYLANSYERGGAVDFDTATDPDTTNDSLVELDAADDGPVRGTIVMRYDRAAGQLVTLDLNDDLDATIDMMENLDEVDIDTWRELVTPYNANPTKPR